MKTNKQNKKEKKNSSELQSRSEQLSGNNNSQTATAPEQQPTTAPQKTVRPYVNFEERDRNRQLPVDKVLDTLRQWIPRAYELAEVVGKWIWITFTELYLDALTDQPAALLSLAKISSGPKTLGLCDISKNPRRHDSLADTRASPGRCWAEIPPELAPGDPGLATPTPRAEQKLQATTPDAAGPGPLGLAFASLGRMEASAVLGSTQHRPSVASRGLSALLAMEKLGSQFRPENHRPGHHPPDRPNESRQSALGCSPQLQKRHDRLPAPRETRLA
jgi:hypothetical protein